VTVNRNFNSFDAIFLKLYVGQTLNKMKTSFLIILVLCLIFHSSFIKDPGNYEQRAFDYFVSEILRSDFSKIKTFEFKGKTEDSYSTLGKYRFCLKPEDKLGSLIDDVTKGSKAKVKEISYEHIKALTIVDFQKEAEESRLFVYPSVRVADHFYVFLSFQTPNEKSVRYILELTNEGNISRSCKVD
jgi:hypothetical protein